MRWLHNSIPPSPEQDKQFGKQIRRRHGCWVSIRPSGPTKPSTPGRECGLAVRREESQIARWSRSLGMKRSGQMAASATAARLCSCAPKTTRKPVDYWFTVWSDASAKALARSAAPEACGSPAFFSLLFSFAAPLPNPVLDLGRRGLEPVDGARHLVPSIGDLFHTGDGFVFASWTK